MKLTRELRHLQPPTQMGHLANSLSAKVPIVRSAPLELNRETYSNRDKFHPLTQEARSPNPGMAYIPLELSKKINKLTLDWSPQEIRQRVAKMYHQLQKGVAHSPAFEQLDVDAQITGIFLQSYVSLTSSLQEIKKRRPDFRPTSILDIGFGPATGLLAFREVFGYTPTKETAVIIGHPRMKRRAKELLGESNEVFFKHDIPTQSSPKRFDLIIATHQLYQHGQLAENLVDSHTQMIAQVLAKNGIALFVERGDPLGFEAVAAAREVMLRPKYAFNVVGPCTHNLKCPLQVGLNIRQEAKHPGKENWCRFSQNVDRPKFTKELKKGQYLSQKWLTDIPRGAGGKTLKGNGRPGANNNEIAHYSWVALENVKNPLKKPDWPRILKQPMKRHGHVTMEVCAPSGFIEHWTVPRSHGKQAYHDVRKSNASDLWALDAKVKQQRGGLRNPEVMATQKRQSEVRPESEEKIPASEWIKEPCKDWWQSSSNPFYKFSSHQARVHSENNVEPEQDGFIPVMQALIADEGRFNKLMNKEIQKRYRR